ncbi:hypothetical protein BO70DRAFT_34287 [Aspergillus heteromorphus CBS 117.55]|uniref:Transmembrane protein n=1 Tax=Aspergillus heteromorphus CBS 117.55 TaxID=1448321 RepID=A0A317W8U9_9EURO|nr:uncharacterized protein BO70DRAFT_34287 [Aspergillus heteromorphus CBS 117.55]PWY83036.1 hypothetical protein BO70DRAFT_34287 [Aspergillus heteromorphus CBS 117.55]
MPSAAACPRLLPFLFFFLFLVPHLLSPPLLCFWGEFSQHDRTWPAYDRRCSWLSSILPWHGAMYFPFERTLFFDAAIHIPSRPSLCVHNFSLSLSLSFFLSFFLSSFFSVPRVCLYLHVVPAIVAFLLRWRIPWRMAECLSARRRDEGAPGTL